MSKPVILIVDDDPMNINAIAASLGDVYTLKVATSGEKCIELSSKDPVPDLILLDIEMPGIDGFETLKRLRGDAESKDIPVIFVTAKDDLHDEELGLDAGAVDYMIKPIRPAIVRARVRTHLTIKKQSDMLKAMAQHDPLTQLPNRLFLTDYINKEFPRARRYEIPITLLLLDIDYFKKINDSYGHARGDQVLIEVAKGLENHVRDNDIVARIGGEEFVIILLHCGMDKAMVKAEQLRQFVQTADPADTPVTVSVGVAELKVDEDYEQLFSRADKALYQAKEDGRNRVRKEVV